MQESAAMPPHAETYGPEYGPRRFANHGPMTRTALAGLGVSGQVMTDFEARYMPLLEPVDIHAGPDINPANFDAFLGKGDNYAGYYRYFRDRLQEDGVAATLGNALRHLAPGLPTAAFHGIIRIGCGLESQDRSEIAAGLAYMADQYLDTSPLMWQRRVDGQPLPASFRRLEYKLSKGLMQAPDVSMPSITDRMRQVINHQDLKAALQEQSLPDYGGLKGLSQSVLAMFLCSRDFTLLHGITGSHALWIISQHVDADTGAMLADWFALALVVTWMSLQNRDFGDDMLQVPFEFVDEDQLKARAVANLEEHEIKLAWSCFALEGIYEQPLYRQAIRLWLDI